MRLLLDELARGFDCEKAHLAFRDAEVERIFVWTVATGQSGRLTPGESAAGSRRRLSAGSSRRHASAGISWTAPDRVLAGIATTGARLAEFRVLPASARKELGMRSMLGVTVDFGGQPVGRMMLGNGAAAVSPAGFAVVRACGAASGAAARKSIFAAPPAHSGHRGRAQPHFAGHPRRHSADAAERGHPARRAAPQGCLQTPEQVAADLGTLQQTVRNETEELRRMVTDMRRLGVQSADLVDLMRGFAERFRNESGLALDLLIDAAALQVPDRICRELFQIYREALHNVKKHARGHARRGKTVAK